MPHRQPEGERVRSEGSNEIQACTCNAGGGATLNGTYVCMAGAEPTAQFQMAANTRHTGPQPLLKHQCKNTEQRTRAHQWKKRREKTSGKGKRQGRGGGGGGAIATATESNTERRTFIIRFDDVDSEPLEKFCRIVRVLPTLSHHRGQLQHSQQHT